MQDFFPRNTTVFRNVVVEVFMSDVDGYAKNILIWHMLLKEFSAEELYITI